MTKRSHILAFIAGLAMTAPALAQDNGTAETEESPDAMALSMGEEETVQEGGVYVLEEHGDWEIRCIKAAEGQDGCQLYQLLDDGQGNPVAEINIFPLAGGEGQPAGGATVITPLETLLTQQLGLSVDGGAVKKYPFSWCSTVGCFSRIGFSEDDINSFRRGISANLIIVPVVAADQKVALKVSLKGFTKGFNRITELVNAN